MYYEPGKTDHGLAHDPFKACVVPRPIGWISTLSPDGKSSNLAPYSQFNNLSFDPPLVMFSSNQTQDMERKDSVVNSEQTGRFCWNLATYELREAVNITAEQVPYGVDEFDRAGVTKTLATRAKFAVRGQSQLAAVPMVAESPVRFECEYVTTLRLPGAPPMGTVDVIVGRVVAIHIDDRVLTDGLLDIRKTRPIARCGYFQYAVIESTFDMLPPGDKELWLAGLEGNSKRQRVLEATRKEDGQLPPRAHL